MFISLFQVIRVHSLVGEVDNKVFRVSETLTDRSFFSQGLPNLGLQGIILFRAAGVALSAVLL
jgi:hypothetical protein